MGIAGGPLLAAVCCISVLCNVYCSLRSCERVCNCRTEKAGAKKSASRGRSRQRKTKKAKSSSEEEDDDDEEGTYVLYLNHLIVLSC